MNWTNKPGCASLPINNAACSTITLALTQPIACCQGWRTMETLSCCNLLIYFLCSLTPNDSKLDSNLLWGLRPSSRLTSLKAWIHLVFYPVLLGSTWKPFGLQINLDHHWEAQRSEHRANSPTCFGASTDTATKLKWLLKLSSFFWLCAAAVLISATSVVTILHFFSKIFCWKSEWACPRTRPLLQGS